MRKLLSWNYFPYGTQYYRAPSPHREDWDRDLKHIADLGMNTVKYWVQWRWNNPAENEFYFDDIDELMDLAAKYDLKVMLNTIVDVAPAWIYSKYPDASMVTLDGAVIGPQTQPHRQIGGLGWCFNHKDVEYHMVRFLEKTVERYRDHPALEIWNMGSEPELTSSMSEMREWADDAGRIGESICYCNHCVTEFRLWLQEKYGSIEKLNEAWNRNYSSFKVAEVPRTRNTFNDIIDWRMFFVHTIGKNIEKRFDVAERIDKKAHAHMCHHVFIQGFPVTSTASDPWNVGKFGDLHGFTQMDDPMMIDILRSCARGKPVISAEMLMLPGYTLDLPIEIDSDDIKRLIFSGIAGNLKGFIFWQFRPEVLGREAPAWGLSRLDGKTTTRLESYSEIGRVLQDKKEFLFKASPERAKVAMIYNPENQVFSWASTGSEKFATDSIMGLFKALYNRNYVIDFLHPEDFNDEILNSYKVVVAPFPYVLDENICTLLKQFVKNGGVLIAEPYFGGWNIEKGHHEKTIPGYGMDEVFGIIQEKAERLPEMHAIKTKKYNQENKIAGIKIRETYTLKTGESVAEFENGDPAIIINSFGKGYAVQLATYFGKPYNGNAQLGNGDLIADIVDDLADIPLNRLQNRSGIRVDVLRHSGEMMVILRNLTMENVSDWLKLTVPPSLEMVEQFSGLKVSFSSSKKWKLDLGPKEVQVWYGK